MKIFLYFFLIAAAQASTLFIDSNAFAGNDSGDPTVDFSGTLHPDPSWAAALPGSEWISYGSTGFHLDPGHFIPADGTVVTFTTEFMLSGAITAADLMVQVDDTASVTLNGHTLIAASITTGTPCGGKPVGCVSSTEMIFPFASLEPYLTDGPNTLSFAVEMVRGESFGVDFAGTVDTTATPEPAPLAVIGAGLLALAALRRKLVI